MFSSFFLFIFLLALPSNFSVFFFSLCMFSCFSLSNILSLPFDFSLPNIFYYFLFPNTFYVFSYFSPHSTFSVFSCFFLFLLFSLCVVNFYLSSVFLILFLFLVCSLHFSCSLSQYFHCVFSCFCLPNTLSFLTLILSSIFSEFC